MDTQFPASVISLGVVNTEKDVIALYFYSQGLSVNAADYKMLERVMRPWIEHVCKRRPNIYHHDSIS